MMPRNYVIVNWIPVAVHTTSGFWQPPWVTHTRTRCKHGGEPCEKCGTTDHRDVRHTTKGGRGCVARLITPR